MKPFDLDDQLQFLEILEREENASISRDVIALSETLWGLRGFIAYDGEVLMAEFASYEDARNVLDRLR